MTQPVRVEEYAREDGSNPYRRWFESLPAQAAAKVAVSGLSSGAREHVEREVVHWNRRAYRRLRTGLPGGTSPEGGCRAHLVVGRRHETKAALGCRNGCCAARRRTRPARHRPSARAPMAAAEPGTGHMALTRHFKQTVVARVRREPAFGRHLLRRGCDAASQRRLRAGPNDPARPRERHAGVRKPCGGAPRRQPRASTACSRRAAIPAWRNSPQCSARCARRLASGSRYTVIRAA